MKKTVAFIGILFLGSAIFSPVSAFFDENVDEIVEAVSSEKVEGLSATAGDASVVLIWNAKQNLNGEEATKYIIEYGTESVEAGAADTYPSLKETIDNLPTTKVEELTNGTKYFFVVRAVFADGTKTPRSEEIMVTPVGAETETEIKTSAEAESTSSENETDPKETTSKKTTPPAVESEKTPTESGEVDPAVQTGDIHNAPNDFVADPADEFNEAEEESMLEGTPPSPETTNSVTPPPAPGEPSSGAEENTVPEPEKDTTPPEDVTNFKADSKARITDYLVTLKWTPSIDSAGDLDDQLLYKSENKGKKWNDAKSLGASAIKTTSPEKPETNITYKLTTKDKTGNESTGVIRSISLPALPSTGPELLLLLGAAFTGAGIRGMVKRK